MHKWCFVEYLQWSLMRDLKGAGCDLLSPVVPLRTLKKEGADCSTGTTPPNALKQALRSVRRHGDVSRADCADTTNSQPCTEICERNTQVLVLEHLTQPQQKFWALTKVNYAGMLMLRRSSCCYYWSCSAVERISQEPCWLRSMRSSYPRWDGMRLDRCC